RVQQPDNAVGIGTQTKNPVEAGIGIFLAAVGANTALPVAVWKWFAAAIGEDFRHLGFRLVKGVKTHQHTPARREADTTDSLLCSAVDLNLAFRELRSGCFGG